MRRLMFRRMLVFASVLAIIGLRTAFAEDIDPANDGSQYSYGENVGWLNAEPSGHNGPGVEIEASKLTGWIWAENMGWISLSCENTSSCGAVPYGVANDGNGNLSGYGWSENVGWINFSPIYGGVTIDSLGDFNGNAWSENIGWITLSATSPIAYGIKTSWLGSLPIPTVSEWGMIIFFILLLGSALWLIRRRTGKGSA